MKGIVLAGGSGTRLHPITKAVSKQLLPVYDKPMIYYPVSILKLAGITEVMIISTERDLPGFKILFGEENFGMKFHYAIQEKPEGIAQAFLIAEEFIGDESCCLILGDNIFYGQSFTRMLRAAAETAKMGRATVFGYPVNDPERFGVAEIKNNVLVGIEEKPKDPKSNFAVTGLYFYPRGVADKAKKLKPSKRGELEITDLNMDYVKEGNIYIQTLGRGFIWFDTGTPKALLQASNLICSLQEMHGMKIADLETMK